MTTLNDAAAAEAAVFYSTPAGDNSIGKRRLQRLADEMTMVDANARAAMRRDRSDLLRDIRDGLPTSLLMQLHGVSYDVIYEARELLNEVQS